MLNQFLVLYCYFSFILGFPTEFGANSQSKKCGKVHLTVSPRPEMYLELNWITECNPPDNIRPDYIALFSKRDIYENGLTLVRIRASDHLSGYYKTNISFGEPRLPGNWDYNDSLNGVVPGPHCFPFWLESGKLNGDVIDANCLGIRPTWMTDISKQIGTQKIGNLFIPGTHNSGSFDGVFPIIECYLLNQDRSVWTQLVHGIRYLDFRVGYYGDKGFFINHDKFKITKIEPIFREIQRFALINPKEIIVIDFHRFPVPSPFNASLHLQFVSLISKYLKEFALPSGNLQVGRGPTLNEIWAQNKNIIICYNEETIAREYSWLWRYIPQHWANAQDVNNLKSFLGSAIKNRTINSITPNPMYALMAELTPNYHFGRFDLSNICKLAGNTNKHVTKWLRDEWSRDANIVATDYFLGNDMINVAIEANIFR